MASSTYPLLRNEADGAETVLTGRVFTFGSFPGLRIEAAGQRHASRPGAFPFQGRKLSHPVPGSRRPHTLEWTGLGRDGGNAPPRPAGAGDSAFLFLEHREGEAVSGGHLVPESAETQPLNDLIDSVVTLLRERDSDVFQTLVQCVSRLLRCDAARVVEEDAETRARSTIARFPTHTGLERFSDRAIDWSKESPHAVLVQESDWEDRNSISSLQKNAVASVLCVALREAGGIIGYLYMDRLGAAQPFTEKDRALCDSLGRLLGEILSHRRASARQQEAIARLQQDHLSPRDPASSIPAKPWARCWTWLRAWLAPTAPSSSAERPAPARKYWPGTCTPDPRARRSRSSPSIAAPFRKT